MAGRSRGFRIARRALALLLAGEYLRSFWMFVLPLPISAILGFLILPAAWPVWWLALGWPLSLPARAILLSRKAGKLFEAGCRAEWDAEGITLIGDAPRDNGLIPRWRLPWTRVRDVVNRGHHLFVRTRKWECFPIPTEALDSEDVALLTRSAETTPRGGEKNEDRRNST